VLVPSLYYKPSVHQNEFRRFDYLKRKITSAHRAPLSKGTTTSTDTATFDDMRSSDRAVAPTLKQEDKCYHLDHLAIKCRLAHSGWLVAAEHLQPPLLSLFCEYMNLEYVRIHGIPRVNQVENAIRVNP